MTDLIVNDQPVRIEMDPQTPLLWAPVSYTHSEPTRP